MTRLRYNGLRAALNASLSAADTVVTFTTALTHSNGVAVPTIAGGNYIPLTIFTATGDLAEIVYLSAYTAGAVTGTIQRAQEGTTAITHAAGKIVACAMTAVDVTPTQDDIPDGATAKQFTTSDQSSLAGAVDATTNLPGTIDARNTATHVMHAHVRDFGSAEPDPTTLADYTALFTRPVSAAVGVVSLDEYISTAAQSTYTTTDSVDPGNTSFVIAAVGAGHSSGTAVAPSSLSGLGLAWTKISGAEHATALGILNGSLWVGAGAGTAGQVSADFGAAQESCSINIWEVLNGNPGITNIAADHNANTSLSVTLAALTSGSATLGFVLKHSSSQSITAGSGYTNLGVPVATTNPSHQALGFWRADGQTLVDCTAGGNAQQLLIGVEIKRSA